VPILNVEADFLPAEIYYQILDECLGSVLLSFCQTCKYFQKAVKIQRYRLKLSSSFRATSELLARSSLPIQPWMERMMRSICEFYFREAHNFSEYQKEQFLMQLALKLNGSAAIIDLFRSKPCPYITYLVLEWEGCFVTPYVQNACDVSLWTAPLVVIDPKISASISDSQFYDFIARGSYVLLCTHPTFKHFLSAEIMARYVIPAWRGTRILKSNEVRVIRFLQGKIPEFFLSDFAAQLIAVIKQLGSDDDVVVRSMIWKWVDFFTFLGVDNYLLKTAVCLGSRRNQVAKIWNIPHILDANPATFTTLDVIELMLPYDSILLPCKFEGETIRLLYDPIVAMENMDTTIQYQDLEIANLKAELKATKDKLQTTLETQIARLNAEAEEETERLRVELATSNGSPSLKRQRSESGSDEEFKGPERKKISLA